METNEINNCQNCRYFAAYYIKNLRAQFIKLINYGLCLNTQIQTRVSDKRIRCGGECEYWQPAHLQEEERNRNIEKVLREMSKRIEEIALVLKDDGI